MRILFGTIFFFLFAVTELAANPFMPQKAEIVSLKLAKLSSSGRLYLKDRNGVAVFAATVALPDSCTRYSGQRTEQTKSEVRIEAMGSRYGEACLLVVRNEPRSLHIPFSLQKAEGYEISRRVYIHSLGYFELHLDLKYGTAILTSAPRILR